jgi:hypothetical protein
MSYVLEIPKIDNEATLGLSGVVNSLAYRVHEIEAHLHNSQQIYGNTTNTMARLSTTGFTVVGGDNAWGTELQLHNGTVIESGSATKKFDFNTLYITAVDAANKPTVLKFFSASEGAAVNCTMQNSGDTITPTGAVPADGTKIVFDSIVTTTGINIYTVYYVVSSGVSTFQVALTSGGTPIVLGTGDGTGHYHVLTQTTLTETVVSAAAVTSDSFPYPIMAPRVTCNSRISVRAASVSGSTVGITFFIGLHTYTA